MLTDHLRTAENWLQHYELNPELPKSWSSGVTSLICSSPRDSGYMETPWSLKPAPPTKALAWSSTCHPLPLPRAAKSSPAFPYGPARLNSKAKSYGPCGEIEGRTVTWSQRCGAERLLTYPQGLGRLHLCCSGLPQASPLQSKRRDGITINAETE